MARKVVECLGVSIRKFNAMNKALNSANVYLTGFMKADGKIIKCSPQLALKQIRVALKMPKV